MDETQVELELTMNGAGASLSVQELREEFATFFKENKEKEIELVPMTNHQLLKNVEEVSLSLPNTLYAFVPIFQANLGDEELEESPLCYPRAKCSKSGCSGFVDDLFWEITQSWPLLFFCVAIQLTFILYIKLIVDKITEKQNTGDAGICPTHSFLRLVSVFVFSAYILKDMVESINIFIYFSHIPTGKLGRGPDFSLLRR